ncbi:MAG: ABC-2 family transporter protein [Rhabdochlamydiaceae bacterium]|nr:ABC-2 family transporter protein [Candidatus Amphrikana amoebophyrae]
MKFFFSLLKVGMRSAMSNRASFIMQSSLMILNNFIFFSIWWFFFRQFKTVGEWNFNDMLVLMSVGTGAYGLNQICFGGIRRLSRNIMDGDLDPYMTQPKNLLLHLAGSASIVKGWGHLFTGLILLFNVKPLYIQSSILIILSMLCGAIVFSSMTVIAHSLAFWLGSIETVSKKYCDSLFLFILYPTNIYSGMMQLVMFTLIPAGVIGYIPVELLRGFTWIKLAWMLCSASIFASLAFLIFYRGLKRYESGNQFGIRN